MSLPKIFLFINSQQGPDWIVTSALAEDGHFLAGHCSSNIWFAHHDIGDTNYCQTDWKHDAYKAHYPDGYEVVWVDGLPTEHEGIKAAYLKHLELPKPEVGDV